LLLLALVLISAIVGLARGLLREAVSLAAWIGGVWLAARYGGALAPILATALAHEGMRLWAGRFLILVLALFAGAVAGRLLGMLARGSGLGGADRVAGMLFGVLRGGLLVGLVIIGLRAAGLDAEPWWQRSKLIPYAAPLTDVLREAAEQGLERSRSYLP
jgi:membrane protein required for colicin V production